MSWIRKGAPREVSYNQVAAEVLYARSIGLVGWEPPIEDTPERGMVGGVLVQWLPSLDAGIYVPEGSPDDLVIVIVTGAEREFDIRGWITAGEVRQYPRDRGWLHEDQP